MPLFARSAQLAGAHVARVVRLVSRGASVAALAALLGGALTGCGGGGGGGGATPRITAPATAAVWGGTRAIRWSSSSSGEARVSLSDDGGATFGIELASATENDGAFSLDTTALGDGVEYRVRLILSKGGTLTSGVFAIDNTAPVTTLTSPVGSEILGPAANVTWTTVDVHPGTVEIRLSSDDGATYPTLLAAAAPDMGSFEFDAAAIGDGAQFRIQVIATDRADNPSAPTRSSGSFELDVTPPVVQITSPVGGESWSGTRAITWTTTDLNPATVDLILSRNSGASFSLSIAESAPDNGTFSWPTGFAPDGTQLRVRIVARDLAGNVSAPSQSMADLAIANLRIVGPVHYLDVDQNGATDAGDVLYVKFDKSIVLNGADAGDFDLGVAGDTFGAGATVGAGVEPDVLLITLGGSPTLRTRGEFGAASVGAGAPSGLDIAASLGSGVIEAAGTGHDAVPSGIKDVRPSLFAVSTGVTTPGAASAAAAGDFDRDGDLDVLVTSRLGSGTQILLGDGLGGFVANGFVAGEAYDVAVGDLDGDGDLDHVIAAGAGARIALGNGLGGFGAYGAPIGSGFTISVALGDFDCDGDLDLILGNGNTGADRVYRNNGAGVFTSTGQALGTGTTTALAVGDVDGDGDLDFVATSGLDGQPVRFWRNDGSGLFTVGANLTFTQAQDVALGDLDGDGDLDVVVAALGQNEVLLNLGGGTFGVAPWFFDNNDNRGIALVDLDGDGDLDVVSVKDLDGERWWFNDGTGLLVASNQRGAVDNAVGVVTGTFDGDGDLDLFVVVDGAAHRAYFNSASGGQPLAALTLDAAALPAYASRGGLALDVDGDGDMDVVLSGVGVGAVVLSNDGAAAFTAGAAFGPPGATVQRAADIDGDGDVDLVIGNPLTAGSEIYWNDGAGVFTAGPTGLLEPISELVDADGDCDLDYVGLTGFGEPRLLFGDGLGGFSDSGAVLGVGPCTTAALVDMDGDGVLDVVLGGPTQVTVALGAGDGVVNSTLPIATNAADRVAVVDFDHDGDLDLLAYAAEGAASFEPFRNELPAPFTVMPLTGSSLVHAGLVFTDDEEDGDLDALTWTTGLTGGSRFAVSDRTGGYSAGASIAVQHLAMVLIADFDRDGDDDAFVVRYDSVTPAAATHRLYKRD